jgi:hypothetical protein
MAADTKPMRRVVGVLSCALLTTVACSSERVAPLDVEPSGPPQIVMSDVERHAEQFDEDLERRPAGSQQEFAAAAYLLGHLQRAGYVVQLDYVPVKDLVRSTNVVAEAPTDPPEVVVVIPYDGNDGGMGIGLFLEVARALRVRLQEHSVGFVALGAESAKVSGGSLGSRRLARRLLDDEMDPVIVELAVIQEGEPAAVDGDASSVFIRTSGLALEPKERTDIVWGAAGFDHVILSGDPVELGDALLEYLEEAGG